MPMPSGSGHALLRRLVALLPPFSSITNSPPARSSHFVLLPLPRRIFSFFGGNGRGEAQEQFRRLERHQALSQWRSLRLATCVIQPIDMVKVRIQLRQGSAVQVPKNMLAQEGFGAFYKNEVASYQV
ncbi:hypothetical protein HPP92_003612 [Vanilla planifolia]|uniref:Uncharacterized protein n=1 Tax=Vanilla planifolia TaxID=51239 RepID=A0A835S3B4_VANPL|nr:hypothetical protein HPP92_003612 [Vanilla planifolia]